MKNIFSASWAILAAIALTFSACHSEKLESSPQDNATGELNLASIKMDIDMKIDTIESRSRATQDVSKFLLAIHNSTNNPVVQYVYSEMPEIISLPVGNYTLIATSSEKAANGFDVPFFKGTSTCEVKENEVSEAPAITCRLANVMLSVEYDAALEGLLGEDVVTTVTLGENSLAIPVRETRKGYLIAPASPAPMDIHLTGTIDGENIDTHTRKEGVKAGQYQKIKIKFTLVDDGTDKETGKLGVVIDVDSSMTSSDETVDVNPGEEDGIEDFPTDSDGGGGDKPGENAPTIIGTNFNGSPFDISKDVLNIPTHIEKPMPLQVTLNAPNKIAHVYVTIDSESLTEEILVGVGLAKDFDLAEPGSLEEGLKGLGFPTGNEVIGKTELLFDITQFTSLLGIYGAANHNFIIRVVDQQQAEVTQTLKIKSVE